MKPIRCLVASDTHGMTERFRTAVKRAGQIDVLFFLGDGLSDLAEILSANPSIPFMAVKGNCDFFNPIPGRSIRKIDSITLNDRKIVLTHGDVYGAKYGLDGLMDLAKNTDADVILYGHTHTRAEHYENGVYYLNPGAVRGDRNPPSVGILTITENGILFSFMDL